MAMAASSGASVKQSITSGKGMADNRIAVAEGVSHPPLKNIEMGFLCAFWLWIHSNSLVLLYTLEIPGIPVRKIPVSPS